MSVFDLRDVLGDLPHDTMVHECYAPTVDALRAEIRANEHALALYRGITRFPAEDTAAYPGTRSALQRECRQRVYGVIQHSRAWGDLIAEHHPHAVRLSIHTQPIGAPKFGIRLLDAPDAWTTPWHSVARCRTDGTWTLMPRAKAAQLGRLIQRDGSPSHFEQDRADAPNHVASRPGTAAIGGSLAICGGGGTGDVVDVEVTVGTDDHPGSGRVAPLDRHVFKIAHPARRKRTRARAGMGPGWGAVWEPLSEVGSQTAPKMVPGTTQGPDSLSESDP
ncbi:Pyoverdine biosynthesis protein [Actinobacteria bacterium OK006]|nr:Pyoverdine biosynthesis protein [Actinobacteria bacterium OK006]